MKKYVSLFMLSALLLPACSDEKGFDATGSFESASEIIVSSEASGKIISFTIDEGDSLSLHQVAGCIDTTQLYLSKLQLGKNASSVLRNRPDISTQIAATEAQIAKQEFEKQRVMRLLSDGAATQKQLDDIESAIIVLKKQLEAQRSSLSNSAGSIDEQSSSIEIQIAQIDDRIKKSIIKSPANGIVLAKYMEEGEFATAGRPLFKIADMQQMYLRAYFTSEQLAQIRIGQQVDVTADFGGDTRYPYKGTIVWIAGQSEFTPKSIQTSDSRAGLVYAVKIAVKNDGRLKIGTYGEVRL